MPILNTVAKTITRPLPKFISPWAHAMLDYVVIGSFVTMGALFWRRNKRAALASFVCGGTELLVNLLTDYPGGGKRIIDFSVHGDLELGLAGMVALMPEFMAFEDEAEKGFFILQGAAMAGITNLTDFGDRSSRSAKRSSGKTLRKAA